MSVQSKPTQNERILNYMSEFGGITQLEALRDLGVLRLASRISDLRRKGFDIVDRRGLRESACRDPRTSRAGLADGYE